MPAAAVSAALAVDPAAEDKVWPVAAPAAAVSVAALVSVPVSVCPAATPVAAVTVALVVPPLLTVPGIHRLRLTGLNSCQGLSERDLISASDSALAKCSAR